MRVRVSGLTLREPAAVARTWAIGSWASISTSASLKVLFRTIDAEQPDVDPSPTPLLDPDPSQPPPVADALWGPDSATQVACWLYPGHLAGLPFHACQGRTPQ